MNQMAPINRATKRLLKRLVKRQPRKPAAEIRWNRLIGERNIFATIDRFLEELATGEIQVDSLNRPIFLAEDLEWYVAAPAIGGWIDLWRRMSGKYQLGLALDSLHVIQTSLHLDQPISLPTVARAQAEVDACRRAYRRLPVAVCREEATNQCIALQLEDSGLITSTGAAQ